MTGDVFISYDPRELEKMFPDVHGPGVNDEIAQEFALKIIALAVRVIFGKIIMGGLPMDFTEFLAAVKKIMAGAQGLIDMFGIEFKIEEQVCQMLDKVVADTSTPIDDGILDWLKDQWQQA